MSGKFITLTLSEEEFVTLDVLARMGTTAIHGGHQRKDNQELYNELPNEAKISSIKKMIKAAKDCEYYQSHPRHLYSPGTVD